MSSGAEQLTGAQAARVKRAVETLGALRSKLAVVSLTEPVYGLVAALWPAAPRSAIRASPLPVPKRSEAIAQGSYLRACAEIGVTYSLFREKPVDPGPSVTRSADRANLDLHVNLFGHDRLRFAEPMVELLGRIGAAYRAYGARHLIDGIHPTDDITGWVDAISSRSQPDVAWLWRGEEWRQVEVADDAIRPRAIAYLDVGAATLQAIDALTLEARTKLASTGLERATPIASAMHSPPNRFFLAGDTWEITYCGQTCYLPDLKGLQTIARLLEASPESVGARDLLGRSHLPAYRGAPAAPPETIEALKRELADLDELPASDANTEKRSRLTAELSRLLGRSGKPRRMGDDGERDRKAVGKRVRDALHRIREQQPKLAAHLEKSLKLSYVCTYVPEPHVSWILAPGGALPGGAPVEQ